MALPANSYKINTAADALEFTDAPIWRRTGGGWTQIGTTYDSSGTNLNQWVDTGIDLPAPLDDHDVFLVTVFNRTRRSRSGSLMFTGAMIEGLADGVAGQNTADTARLSFDAGDQTDQEYWIGKTSSDDLLIANEQNTNDRLDISLYMGGGGSGGGGSSTFTGLTDTPAMLGSAGQYIRVNSAGTALEFTAAPMGGGGGGTSRYLPSPDERATEGGFLYMGWTDDFSSSWGIRRVSLTTGAAATATVANNSAYTTLAAAWPQRASLTYA